jgi:hypothetical protein
MQKIRKYFYCFFLLSILYSCDNKNKTGQNEEVENTVNSVIVSDSIYQKTSIIIAEEAKIEAILQNKLPIILLKNLGLNENKAQEIAINDPTFCKNLLDKKTRKAYRNEIFNVYEARPQELAEGAAKGTFYKVELYNYALNLTTNAMVDLAANKVVNITTLPQTQPEIPAHLKDLAINIAKTSKEVIEALGYNPNDAEALMANTKTALNNTKCERSLHLCVAPTFIKDDKALWAIIDLTDLKLVGVRWTNTGTTGPGKRISERNLKFDKIMECYCKKVTPLAKQNWKLNYVITNSDGLRISEVKYNDKLVINNAKVVDWHVNYSNTDGFGYSDAVGCPEFSQAAVIAVSDPIVSEIIENGKNIGFALEQNFSSQQWPQPCNYNYLQRYEFYNDGRFRPISASLGRGCGNNGTYRPVTRIAFTGNKNTLSEWTNTNWLPWKTEQWKLQNAQTAYTTEGYQYKISDNAGSGFYLEPGKGQFKDNGRGDNAYLYITKLHADKEEGEQDLISIGPCCNIDYRQGPEKFIEPKPDNIENTDLVLWYVTQMKNDDTKGREYCWAESILVKGVYKTKVFPCLSGPMFIPIKK